MEDVEYYTHENYLSNLGFSIGMWKLSLVNLCYWHERQ